MVENQGMETGDELQNSGMDAGYELARVLPLTREAADAWEDALRAGADRWDPLWEFACATEGELEGRRRQIEAKFPPTAVGVGLFPGGPVPLHPLTFTPAS